MEILKIFVVLSIFLLTIACCILLFFIDPVLCTYKEYNYGRYTKKVCGNCNIIFAIRGYYYVKEKNGCNVKKWLN